MFNHKTHLILAAASPWLGEAQGGTGGSGRLREARGGTGGSGRLGETLVTGVPQETYPTHTGREIKS